MNQQVIVGKEHALSAQISTLLNIVNHVTSALSPAEHFSGTPGTPLDGGVKSSLESTLIRACNRLDAIIDGKKNWGTDDQQQIVKEICQTHRAQQAFLKAQTDAANEVRRPAFQLRPTLSLTQGGGYVAIYGDIKTPGGYILGTGATPEAALLDFDAAFSRTPEQQHTVQHETPSKKKR